MATLSKGKTFTNGETVTPQKLHELVDLGSVTNIQAADIANYAVTTAKLADAAVTTAKLADAAVTDAKLATIATAGKVANSATTAVSGNTPSAIVARDASGNFSAGTMTGNATTATQLQTARQINGVAFDGSANITVTATPTAHTHGNLTNAGAIGTTPSIPIITGSSGVLQAGSFGTTAGTFCQGNDSRLSDARTPSSHTHGNLTNAGAIGTTASLPIVTGASGVLQAGSFGTTIGTFCQGNDSRLSDARVPTSHSHSAADITTGTLVNARTTATEANTPSAIVARDASGNFSAGTITVANIGLTAATTATTATAGTSGALPAQAAGYLVVAINGVSRRIPFYA